MADTSPVLLAPRSVQLGAGIFKFPTGCHMVPAMPLWVNRLSLSLFSCKIGTILLILTTLQCCCEDLQR